MTQSSYSQHQHLFSAPTRVGDERDDMEDDMSSHGSVVYQHSDRRDELLAKLRASDKSRKRNAQKVATENTNHNITNNHNASISSKQLRKSPIDFSASALFIRSSQSRSSSQVEQPVFVPRTKLTSSSSSSISVDAFRQSPPPSALFNSKSISSHESNEMEFTPVDDTDASFEEKEEVHRPPSKASHSTTASSAESSSFFKHSRPKMVPNFQSPEDDSDYFRLNKIDMIEKKSFSRSNPSSTSVNVLEKKQKRPMQKSIDLRSIHPRQPSHSFDSGVSTEQKVLDNGKATGLRPISETLGEIVDAAEVSKALRIEIDNFNEANTTVISTELPADGPVPRTPPRKSWLTDLDDIDFSLTTYESPRTSLTPNSDRVRRHRPLGELSLRLNKLNNRREADISINQHKAARSKEQLELAGRSGRNLNDHLSGISLSPTPVELSYHIIVKILASVSHFGLYFAIAQLCSPYEPRHSNTLQFPEVKLPLSFQHQPLFDHLHKLVDTQNIPSSLLVYVIFQSSTVMQLKLSSPTFYYLQINWPWTDIGQLFTSPAPILINVWNCVKVKQKLAEESENTEFIRATASQPESLPLTSKSLSNNSNYWEAFFSDLGGEHEKQNSSATITDTLNGDLRLISSPPPLPSDDRHPLMDCTRLSLNAILRAVNLENIAIHGIIQCTFLRGHTATSSSSEVSPAFDPFTVYPSFILQDETGIVEILVPPNLLHHWESVFCSNTQYLALIDVLSCVKINNIDRVSKVNAKSLMKYLSGGDSPPASMLSLMLTPSSRWLCRKVSNDLVTPVPLFQDNIVPLQAIFSNRNVYTYSGGVYSYRMSITGNIVQIEWKPNKCTVWITDESFCVSPCALPSQLPCTVCVHFTSFRHLQQLRTFFSSSAYISVRFLHAEQIGPDPGCVLLTADLYTELSYVTNQATEEFPSLPSLLVRTDITTHKLISVPQLKLSLPFSFSQLPSLSPICRSTRDEIYLPARHQLHGVFQLEGVIMNVIGSGSETIVCENCKLSTPGLESVMPKDRFCVNCGSMRPNILREFNCIVAIQCADLMSPILLRMSHDLLISKLPSLPSAKTRELVQNVEELKNFLIPQRVRCICRCMYDLEIICSADSRPSQLYMLSSMPSSSVKPFISLTIS